MSISPAHESVAKKRRVRQRESKSERDGERECAKERERASEGEYARERERKRERKRERERERERKRERERIFHPLLLTNPSPRHGLEGSSNWRYFVTISVHLCNSRRRHLHVRM